MEATKEEDQTNKRTRATEEEEDTNTTKEWSKAVWETMSVEQRIEAVKATAEENRKELPGFAFVVDRENPIESESKLVEVFEQVLKGELFWVIDEGEGQVTYSASPATVDYFVTEYYELFNKSWDSKPNSLKELAKKFNKEEEIERLLESLYAIYAEHNWRKLSKEERTKKIEETPEEQREKGFYAAYCYEVNCRPLQWEETRASKKEFCDVFGRVCNGELYETEEFKGKTRFLSTPCTVEDFVYCNFNQISSLMKFKNTTNKEECDSFFLSLEYYCGHNRESACYFLEELLGNNKKHRAYQDKRTKRTEELALLEDEEEKEEKENDDEE